MEVEKAFSPLMFVLKKYLSCSLVLQLGVKIIIKIKSFFSS